MAEHKTINEDVVEFAKESPMASTIEEIWREIEQFLAGNSAGIRNLSTALT